MAIIAGNWKMYKTVPEAVDFVKTLAPLVADSQGEVLLAVPYTAIRETSAVSEVIQIGAQNMNDATEGAFTGEIAARMLVDAGASFVVLGHSERRHIFGETSEMVNRKVHRALADGLRVIICVGEQEGEEREAVVRAQVEESLAGVDDLTHVMIAYEPVWAIGTGKTATPEIADSAHAFIKGLRDTEVLYGGSVKPANAAELLAQPNIDGVLVGGASLDPENFAQIVNAQG